MLPFLPQLPGMVGHMIFKGEVGPQLAAGTLNASFPTLRLPDVDMS